MRRTKATARLSGRIFPLSATKRSGGPKAAGAREYRIAAPKAKAARVFALQDGARAGTVCDSGATLRATVIEGLSIALDEVFAGQAPPSRCNPDKAFQAANRGRSEKMKFLNSRKFPTLPASFFRPCGILPS
jgi:hypothetical protein